MSRDRTLLVGIGSPHGDDQVGWRVVQSVSERLDAGRVSVRLASAPAQLLDWLDGIRRLVVCDACRGLGEVGQWRWWEWPLPELPAVRWYGTHDLSLVAVLGLAERLQRLPPQSSVWAIEAAAPHTVADLSPEIQQALPQLVDEIVRSL